jgi:Flp pilus assembly protein TadG
VTKQRRLRSRDGAAVVEFAMCLPVIVFIIFAGMDVTTLIRAKQAVVETTHETARIVAANEASEAQCRQFAVAALARKNYSKATIDFSPALSATMLRGTPITISISIPVAGNCPLLSHLYGSLTLDAQSTVSREIGDFSLEQLSETDD